MNFVSERNYLSQPARCPVAPGSQMGGALEGSEGSAPTLPEQPGQATAHPDESRGPRHNPKAQPLWQRTSADH